MTDTIISAVLDLHEALCLPPMNMLGLWEIALPRGWHLAVCGDKHPRRFCPPGGMEYEVQPYHFAVWFNGWLAGDLHPIDGGLLAAGTAANEQTLMASLRQAAEKAAEENPK